MKNLPKNQTEEVLAHLMEFGSITSMDAITMYGITRLSAKIFELRQDGHNIQTFREGFVSRYGNKSSYGRYKLIGG